MSRHYNQDSEDQDIKRCQKDGSDSDRDEAKVENIIKVNEEFEKGGESNMSTSVVHVTSNQMFDVDARASDDRNPSLPSALPSNHLPDELRHLHQFNQLERMRGTRDREIHGSLTSREVVGDDEIVIRRQFREDRTKATCSDHAMVLSLTINVLSLILTIAVIILVVALMMSLAATSHLHSRIGSEASSSTFHAPFSPRYFAREYGENPEYSSEQNAHHSNKYKISEKQFPFPPFPPLSSPLLQPSSSDLPSSSVIFSSSAQSRETGPEGARRKEDIIIGEKNGNKINEEKNDNEDRRDEEWKRNERKGYNSGEGNENHDEQGWNKLKHERNHWKRMKNGYNIITRVNEDGVKESSFRVDESEDEDEGKERSDAEAKRDTEHHDDDGRNNDRMSHYLSYQVEETSTIEPSDKEKHDEIVKKLESTINELISKVVIEGNRTESRSPPKAGGNTDEDSIEAFGQIIALGPLLVLSSICGIAASQKHTGTTSVVIYWCFLTVTLVLSVYITSFHIDYDSIIGLEPQEKLSVEETSFDTDFEGKRFVEREGSENPRPPKTTAIEAVSTLVIVIGSFQLFAAIVVTFAKYQKKRVAIFEKDPNYNYYAVPGNNPRDAFTNGIPVVGTMERSYSLINIVTNQLADVN